VARAPRAVAADAAENTTRTRWTLVATILASAMTFIDGTVVNVALPALQNGLDATITDVQWVIEAYALFLGALILVGGSLGDQLGRKRVFLAGVVAFTAASVVCGVAPSPSILVVGRALQGIGAAFLVPGSLAIITAAFTGAERGRAIGTWSGFSAITTAIGPVLGGWLVEHVTWRAVFFINVPFAAIVVFLSLRYMDESKDPSRGTSIDWLGASLAVVGLSGLIFGLLEWPALGGTLTVIAALGLGALFLVLFVVVEARVRNPMLPLGLFGSRAFTLTNLLTFFLYAALAEALFMIPLQLIQVRGYTATAAGAAILPFPIIMFALSRWSGGLVARIGSRLPLTVGPIVTGVGFALCVRVTGDASFVSTFLPAIIVVGLGMAIAVAPLTTTVMDSVSGDHSGTASGVNNAVARIAGLVAIAVFGVVVARTFDERLTSRLDSIELSVAARDAVNRERPKMAGVDVDAIPSLPRDRRADVHEAFDQSFAAAFRVSLWGTALLALVAGAIGSGIVRPQLPNDGERMDEARLNETPS
jgi:EmrB/QacA subfamily drug resistance transporter